MHIPLFVIVSFYVTCMHSSGRAVRHASCTVRTLAVLACLAFPLISLSFSVFPHTCDL